MADALGSVLALMTRALGGVFAGPSWGTWRAVLSAAFALPLTDAERAIVTELTSRQVLPTKAVRELWLLLGRRSGKSIVAALIAVWATTCRSYHLAPGEVGVFMVIASDRRQARVIKRYISGLLKAAPALAALLDHETADAIWLTNGLCLEIHACSFRSLRGYTCVGAAVDEVSFWTTEDSANPDTEVLSALRAAMASVPEAMLVGVTTLYAKRGEVGRVWDRYHGQDDAGAVLVVNGPTLTMNPTIDPDVIAAAYLDDPISASAEYGGLFRRDVESLLTRDAIAAVTMPGRLQLPPMATETYYGFVDPAGGSGTDSFTAAVAHVDQEGRGVLDYLFEQKPPFSPAATVKAIADALQPYGIVLVEGDRFAGEWPREQFQAHGITYWPSAKTKSDIYRDVVPLVNSKRLELLDVPRLASQFVGLERRTARGGKDSIDHGPGAKAHDDVCNAAAGALVQACDRGALAGAQAPVPPALPSAAEQRLRARLAAVADDPRYRDVPRQPEVIAPPDDGFSAGLRVYQPFALTTAADRAAGIHRSQLGLMRTVPEHERRALREARRDEERAGEGWAEAVLRRLEDE